MLNVIFGWFPYSLSRFENQVWLLLLIIKIKIKISNFKSIVHLISDILKSSLQVDVLNNGNINTVLHRGGPLGLATQKKVKNTYVELTNTKSSVEARTKS